jgi:hypothetical protein
MFHSPGRCTRKEIHQMKQLSRKAPARLLAVITAFALAVTMFAAFPEKAQAAFDDDGTVGRAGGVSPYNAAISDVNVTIRIVGASLSDAPIDLTESPGDYKGSVYETWISTTSYAIAAGSTVYDLFLAALADAGMAHDNSMGYVTAVSAPAILGGYSLTDKTNGEYCGWMFDVNSVMPNAGMDQTSLAEGDAILVYYVNDYMCEWDSTIAAAARDVAPGVITAESKDALAADIAAADAKIASLVQAEYTADSWNAVVAALESAKAIAAKAGATRPEIEAANAGIARALDGLQKAPPKQQEEQQQQQQQELPKNTVNIAASTVKMSVADKVWTGKQISSSFVVKEGDRTLRAGVDYTTDSYGANRNIGKGTVKITGKGDYSGERTLTFNIVPKKAAKPSAKAGKRQLKIKWKKGPSAAKVTKYQVRYRVKNTNKWTVKTFNAKSAKGGSASLTVKNLKKGKYYQVQIRAYKKINSGNSKGTYYGEWSATSASAKKVS